MKYKLLEHTADIKFRSFGTDLEEVFKNSGIALKEIVYKGKVNNEIKKKIKVKGNDMENLMYNFLEEFLFLLDSDDFLMSDILKIEIDGKKFKLKCELVGDKSKNYKTDMHVKAITYHEMFVKKIKEKWMAQVVVDI
jgi:SHS2 domain-containing protein